MIREHAIGLPAALICLLTGCAGLPADLHDRLARWEETASVHAAQVAPAGLADDADLVDLVRHALRSNPGLQAAFERWKAALERVPQAVALPEPRLTFAYYLSEVETRVGPLEGRVGLTQPLPWFGKLEEAGQVAFRAAEVEREALEVVRLELLETVRNAWYEYAWLAEAVAITRGHRELLAHWEEVARARFETGLGSHSDVIRAQVELGKLEDRLSTLTDLRRPIAARLNAALNRAPDAALPEPGYPLPEPQAVDEAGLRSAIHRTSPLLRAIGQRLEGARHGVALARKAFYPDFVVGVEYGLVGSARSTGVSGSGDDTLALTLGLDLPVWRASYRAGLREAEARLRAAQSELDEATNTIASSLEMALYELRDAQRRVGLFRDTLIPKGEESVAALDTAYQAGDQGFLDLIDAERVLLEFQLQAARAQADRAQALAKTERLTGASLHQEP